MLQRSGTVQAVLRATPRVAVQFTPLKQDRVDNPCERQTGKQRIDRTEHVTEGATLLIRVQKEATCCPSCDHAGEEDDQRVVAWLVHAHLLEEEQLS